MRTSQNRTHSPGIGIIAVVLFFGCAILLPSSVLSVVLACFQLMLAVPCGLVILPLAVFSVAPNGFLREEFCYKNGFAARLFAISLMIGCGCIAEAFVTSGLRSLRVTNRASLWLPGSIGIVGAIIIHTIARVKERPKGFKGK